MKTLSELVIHPWAMLFAGLLVGGAGVFLLQQDGANGVERPTSSSRAEPLYWVAPMDPNYRRDKPGKSPMGMDLVPVYAEDSETANAGGVRIPPEVAHNLGTRTAVAETRSLVEQVPVFARIEFDESALVHVHPRVDGWIEQLSVAATGDAIAQGEPLFALYSPTWVNAQEELVAAVERNQSALIAGAIDRLRALHVPDSVIESVKTSGRVQHSIAVPAPASGVITTLNVREGMFVQPGMEMMSIAPTDTLWMVVEGVQPVSPKALGSATIETSTPSASQSGMRLPVDYVYPMADSTRRTWKVRALIDNSEGELMPGMFVDAVLELPASEPVLVIPREALIRTGDSARVVVALDDDRYQSVEVIAGRHIGNWIELKSGLEPGQRVVTSAQFMIDSESNRSAALADMAQRPASMQIDTPSAMDHSGMDHSSMNHAEMDHSSMDHSSMNHAEMDHLAMDHSSMNHAEMDHSSMDHSSMNHGEMNHSGMDHSSMNHAEMDHSSMDHSSMNHGEMDHSGMDHSSMNHAEMDHSPMNHTATHGPAAAPEPQKEPRKKSAEGQQHD